MVGRIPSQFRSGNLAEDLGIFLLKGVAAVAEVSRPEDVGVDAIATLLRPGDDGSLYANETFFVQLKSASVKQINYQQHEVTWFLNQSLPFLLGMVSIEDGRIDLYPTIAANQAVVSFHATTVEFRVGTAPHGYPWEGVSGTGHAIVWLGTPIMSWTIRDVASPEWRISQYPLLSQLIHTLKRERRLIALGQISQVTWRTNDADSLRHEFVMRKGNPQQVSAMAESCVPHLHALLFSASSATDESQRNLCLATLTLLLAIQECGVSVDSDMIRICQAMLTSKTEH